MCTMLQNQVFLSGELPSFGSGQSLKEQNRQWISAPCDPI